MCVYRELQRQTRYSGCASPAGRVKGLQSVGEREGERERESRVSCVRLNYWRVSPRDQLGEE